MPIPTTAGTFRGVAKFDDIALGDSSKMPESPPTPDPKRFEVSRTTLWFDRFMGGLIRFGGIGVILAVFGIFYFVGKEVIPLFRSAEISPAGKAEAATAVQILGTDEWAELPFFYDGGTRVQFVNMASGERSELEVAGLEDVPITAISHDPVHQRVALGTADGRVGSFVIQYERKFSPDQEPWVEPSLVMEPWFEVESGKGPVTAV
ncbi:MAG: hypothetical protein ACO3RV_08045, partial [Luteolibacter sp.]